MTVESKEKMLFKLYAPSTQKSYDLNDDGTLTIEGVASTTNKDLEGDVILQSAIDSMKIQLTTSHKNLHGDHKYNLFKGILGAITKVVDSDDNILKIRATILSKYAAFIKEMLDIGVQLGLSIGGRIKDYDQTNDGWEIKDIDLFEISLTGMPANYDTFGTVVSTKKTGVVEAKCLAGACNLIRKNMEANKMAEENNSQNNEQYVTREQCESICKDFLDTFIAENKEEIQNAVLEACKADIERIVDERIKELTEPQPPEPQNNEGEAQGEKSFVDELKSLKEELLDEINKNKFTDEDLQKGLADYINKERNPTPTPAPTVEGGEDETAKTFTVEEIFKNIEANQKSSGILSRLGANKEE
ncbi:MAG: HK97 family phage prohead protease [Methanobrevibacter sp.]|nr:HK97 family phage prohead protease [Methanobrevibacter sp.]